MQVRIAATHAHARANAAQGRDAIRTQPEACASGPGAGPAHPHSSADSSPEHVSCAGTRSSGPETKIAPATRAARARPRACVMRLPTPARRAPLRPAAPGPLRPFRAGRLRSRTQEPRYHAPWAARLVRDPYTSRIQAGGQRVSVRNWGPTSWPARGVVCKYIHVGQRRRGRAFSQGEAEVWIRFVLERGINLESN